MTLLPKSTKAKIISVSGFSVIELVAVLVVIGILATVMAPRLFNNQLFDLRSFADRTQSALSFAQKLAIAQNRNVFVRIDGTSIALCYIPFNANAECTPENRITPPAGKNSGTPSTINTCGSSSVDRSWLCEAPPSSATVSTTPFVSLFHFSPLGKPFLGNTANELPQVKILIVGISETRTLFVERETGYVHR